MLDNEINQLKSGVTLDYDALLATDLDLAQPMSMLEAMGSMVDAKEVEEIASHWLKHIFSHRHLDSQQAAALIRQAIVDLDDLLQRQIDNILHHPEFQQLEASWRSLHYLVETEAEYDEDLTVKIKVLDVSWAELARDVTRAIEFDQSQLFHRIYSDEFDMPGGEPFGVMLGDYQISHKAHKGVSATDIEVLNEMAQISTAALCPFISNVSSTLFGLDDMTELGQPLNLDNTFRQTEYAKWRSMREHEDMRFVGLTVPSTLMREPFEDDSTRPENFRYRERVVDTEDYLWGNACYAFGGVLIRAFANTGWFADIRSGAHDYGEGGAVKNLFYAHFESDKKRLTTRPATNVQINDFLERDLGDLGFIPLCSYHTAEHSAFYSNNSLHDPIEYDSEIATINARLSSMIQYMLCVSRFGHYIKVMVRDKIGSFVSAIECQNFLQSWLNGYSTSSEGLSAELKARYPLASSKVDIHEKPGRPGYFTCVVHLQPHFQLDQLVSSIRLVTELAVGTNSGEASI